MVFVIKRLDFCNQLDSVFMSLLEVGEGPPSALRVFAKVDLGTAQSLQCPRTPPGPGIPERRHKGYGLELCIGQTLAHILAQAFSLCELASSCVNYW